MIELKALQGQVKALAEDLRGQITAEVELRAELHKEYDDAHAAQRTGGTFETWLEEILDQAAVAWVLDCVFVRFCEDNGLVDGLWIGGPTDEAPVERAVQNRQAYLIANPRHNDRHWLREGFSYLRGLRATGKIFDEHNPVWRFDISGRAAEALSDFFRRGAGCRSLRSSGLDTRFLGDLYQDLSAHARQTYALLQTPEFVEEFILDRTFEPAYREFGLAETTVIDPTCGSGHFLLGAFRRLIARWKEREPATDVRELTQRALHQITGVDINPLAVAIARFRLMVAALNECGMFKLERAPAFDVRVAAGDSLLDWGEKSRHQGDLMAELEERPTFAYATEDADVLANYLRSGTYTTVVGNPPYITVKDKVLNARYRDMYPACSGKYALTVPFAQRFFQMARRADHDGDGAGWVGQITSNSFMKREFGKKLINVVFAHDVELADVVDTSGAFIPGHGTPTVILVGRNRMVSARYSGPVRTVLGIRGEPSQPVDPSKGLVWTAILDQIDRPGSESEWISAVDASRASIATHPWSMSGGGANSVMLAIESEASRLGNRTTMMGFAAITAEDDAFFLTAAAARRIAAESTMPMVTGDVVRDYLIDPEIVCIFPYQKDLNTAAPPSVPRIMRHLWPNRRVLQRRKRFGTFIEDIPSLQWHEFGELYREKLRTELSITFAFVATHNHFALDRGGRIFNRSAPVIKLPEGATEDDHLRLLGVLNSSTACFWLKEVSQPKAGGGVGRGMQDEAWEERYEFTGTKLQEFPIPSRFPLERSRFIDQLANRLNAVSPAMVVNSGTPRRQNLAEAEVEYHSVRGQMVSIQEELDWETYQIYGLIDENLTCETPPELQPGQRAFEIAMTRSEIHTEWFRRHKSTSITELPDYWPGTYKQLVERRIAALKSNRHLALVERPEYKRRWSQKRDKEPWDWAAQQSFALRSWLLDRLEVPELWGGAPSPMSIAQLADRLRHDEEFRSVLDIWAGTDQHDILTTLTRLIADEHVPFLSAQRYKPSGLRKRAQWERTWTLQRREDEGEKVDIPVPPKFATADFAKASYWRNRNKLDVPNERFVSYPDMGREGDSSLLLGWAGWDHLAQAQALATVYLDRKTQAGWPPEHLLPLLAGMAELEPWLHQWYAEPRPGFAGTPAQFFTGLIDTELGALGADRAALTTLRGVEELT
ncbi:BREX-2 system adenine-specific DNA-methyltransferase PglX [Krasilnikovia sp. MM14-A1004]|uniref:BREX-2 system adenine-specific DNA-methyltransferase PglX n=1 Tax=Krasilnikovia sp. MM14-A1004 TaxID=3373541 RepID=UPI00399C6006